MRFPLHAAVVVTIGPWAVACGPGNGGDTGPAFSLGDSAGVELAVTAFSEPVPQTGWVIDPSSAILYGEAGDDEVHFTWIRAAAQLPDGRVVALDPRAPEMLIFAPKGDLLSRTGREGDGPGEFKRPGGVLHVGGDTIVVYDASQMRFSLFDTEGNFLADRRLEAPQGGEDAPRLTMYAAIDAIGDTITLRGEGFSIRSTSSGDYVWENPTLRYTTGGGFIGEVGEPAKMWFYKTSDGPRPQLLGGAQNVAGKAGIVYVGDRDRYEVRVYDPPARLIRIQRLERQLRPVVDEMLEAYRSELKENIPDPSALERTLELIEHSPVADSLPWIRDIMADELGNVWIMEYAPPGRDSVAVGVFSAKGEWLGAVRMPPDFRPLEIGADYVLGVRTDELDVPHLVRYGLDRSPPPMETAEND